MLKERFGEVVFITRDKYPEGVMIRERVGGIVLEQHFDATGQNADILHMFPEESSIWNKEDFIDCLTVARKYEPDLSAPIYVQR